MKFKQFLKQFLILFCSFVVSLRKTSKIFGTRCKKNKASFILFCSFVVSLRETSKIFGTRCKKNKASFILFCSFVVSLQSKTKVRTESTCRRNNKYNRKYATNHLR